MLQGRDLRFRWRPDGPWVLDGASIDAADGEIVGIAGPSGGGKTTLAKILAGHLAPEQGSVTLDGRPLPATGTSPVQLLFQNAETAVNPRWRVGSILAEAYTPSADVLDAFGIDPRNLERYPHEISGGELQRIAIVRALAPNLRVLIADEMTAMLDAISQAAIWRALLAYAAPRGIAILAVSHDRALLDALGARRLVLDAGRSSPGP